jgi:alpha-glucosidase
VTGGAASSSGEWWRDAVVYEVYLRSFADSDGDGVGDLGGLRRRLPYLAGLGVDALWLTPWYPSPMADGGYDVADYCDIDPRFGTLADADALLADAHALGLRVVTDLVANHTSVEHPWFTAALAAGPGSPERGRYFFRDGRAGGDEPPNDWISAFGGRAWTRVTEPDGTPGQWYLHLFAPEQPDLDWDHPGVRDDFDAILRFWFDRGIDGIRVDAAPAMAKVAGLPDAGHGPDALFESRTWVGNPHWDVDAVHDILRRWRRIGNSYERDRLFVTEAVVNGPERLSRYVRPDEMHTSFNFDYLTCPWDAGRLREVIDASLAALAPVGAPATWVLSSHDETRHATRFGRADTAAAIGSGAMGFDPGAPADRELGLRRARAAALLTLALPGSAYVYQGEELGLPEVEDLPEELLQDPTWERSGHTARGRDGCRVPLPWEGDRPPFGFTRDDVVPWLPQPPDWAELTVAAQQADPASTLSLYRAALRLRRGLPGLRDAGMTWRDAPGEVLAFDRGTALRCVVNFSGAPLDLTGHGRLLLTSAPCPDGLPPDAAAWLAPEEEGSGARLSSSA